MPSTATGSPATTKGAAVKFSTASPGRSTPVRSIRRLTSPPAASTVLLFVLGYDDQHKPRGARFNGGDAKVVVEAAKAMSLNVYEAATDDLAALAKNCRKAACTRTAKGLCPIFGRLSIARSFRRWPRHRRRRSPRMTRLRCPRSRRACQEPGTSLRLAIWSSLKRPLNTDGGKRLSSTAMATCCRCGFGIIPSCQSLFGIGRLSR